ncbi:MAG: ferrous iron transport protein A [Cyanobacteria bacterium NC_groundwater_1444_Ag_S-0.65um_54_12]|nr:ferrous iron transport protein A [Cyanobacteria bacterium NC_groundwater_1444_Ag_S-0.65um_54_12]
MITATSPNTSRSKLGCPQFLTTCPSTELSKLAPGQTVRIGALEGNSDLCFKLLELGFTPGQEITPLARAPFGGPLAVALRGTIVALRSDEAACIKL